MPSNQVEYNLALVQSYATRTPQILVTTTVEPKVNHITLQSTLTHCIDLFDIKTNFIIHIQMIQGKKTAVPWVACIGLLAIILFISDYTLMKGGFVKTLPASSRNSEVSKSIMP